MVYLWALSIGCLSTLYSRFGSQLPHSYYFTTSILVLKFANKEVFFKGIQNWLFPRKRGYFCTHLHEFGEKGVNFDAQCLLWKWGFISAEKSVFYCKKGGSFWTEKSVFYHEKGVVLSWKVSVLPQKRGSFSNWRTRMGTTFSSGWGSRGLGIYINKAHLSMRITLNWWVHLQISCSSCTAVLAEHWLWSTITASDLYSHHPDLSGVVDLLHRQVYQSIAC